MFEIDFKGEIEKEILKVFGISVTIEHCDGYVMFEDADDKIVVGKLRSNIVEVNHLSDMDLPQWVEAFRTLLTRSCSLGD